MKPILVAVLTSCAVAGFCQVPAASQKAGQAKPTAKIRRTPAAKPAAAAPISIGFDDVVGTKDEVVEQARALTRVAAREANSPAYAGKFRKLHSQVQSFAVTEFTSAEQQIIGSVPTPTASAVKALPSSEESNQKQLDALSKESYEGARKRAEQNISQQNEERKRQERAAEERQIQESIAAQDRARSMAPTPERRGSLEQREKQAPLLVIPDQKK